MAGNQDAAYARYTGILSPPRLTFHRRGAVRGPMWGICAHFRNEMSELGCAARGYVGYVRPQIRRRLTKEAVSPRGHGAFISETARHWSSKSTRHAIGTTSIEHGCGMSADWRPTSPPVEPRRSDAPRIGRHPGVIKPAAVPLRPSPGSRLRRRGSACTRGCAASARCGQPIV